MSVSDGWNSLFGGRVRRYAPVALYALLSFIAIYPVLIVEIPPLVDYPAHLAGRHIQMSIAEIPHLQEHYALRWTPLPNLAMAAILLPLTAVFSLFDAGRVFVAGAILLPVAGAAVLRKAVYGRVGYAPAFAFLTAYNSALAWGFLNFLFGAGLCLIVFAGWIASRHWRPPVRIALFSAMALILYFTHLFAFATYAVLVATYTVRPLPGPAPRPMRRLLVDLAVAGTQFVGPALLVLPTLFSGGASYTAFNGISSRFRIFLSPFYSVGTAADVLLATLAVLVLYWAIRNRRIALAPEVRLPLIVITVIAAIIPEWLMQTWAANLRLPTVAVLILLAGARLRPPPVRWQIALVSVLVALFVARVWAVAEVWTEDALKFAEFRAAAVSVPVGARVIPVQPKPEDTPNLRRGFPQAYWTLPALLAIDRSAFVPTLFTDPGKQVLTVTPRNYLIDTPFGKPAEPAEISDGAKLELRGATPPTRPNGNREYWTDWPHRFDYMVVVSETAPLAGLETLLLPVHKGSFFAIYRIVPGSCRLDPASPEGTAPVCAPDEG